MSRMSAWNRPSKHAAIPPPYYITSGADTPYCHTCGRVMNSRKTAKTSSKQQDTNTKSLVKYCSERCRRRKPGQLDRDIEQTFLTLLRGNIDLPNGEVKSGQKAKKGDSRILVKMDDVEELMFGKQPESEKRRTGKRHVIDSKTWRSVDMESSDSNIESDVDDPEPGGAVLASMETADKDMIELRPKQPQSTNEIDPGDHSGHVKSTPTDVDEAENVTKRDEGQKRAEHKEMVRRAARRAVVFGFPQDGHEDIDPNNRHKCEAVVNGLVVEPSFAKGNWGIRWRD